MNAQINVAATVDYKNAIKSFFQGTEYTNAFDQSDKTKSSQHTTVDLRKLINFGTSANELTRKNRASLDTLQKSVNIHTDGSPDTPNLVFAKIKMDPIQHPFFKRTWSVFHTLNEESPLLTKSARKRVQENGGYWPADMNNIVDVRNSIDFDEFLISFNGLSKATGSDVYGYKMYKPKDLQVGYQFKSMLVENRNGSISVEDDDIDEVTVQEGGFNYRQLRGQFKRNKQVRSFDLSDNIE